MLLIIDAYNLLKYILKVDRVPENEIKHFIKIFKKYAEKRHFSIMVIFDGGPLAYTSRERHGLVEIIYSGYSQTADDVIKDILENNLQKDALLISSDLELQKCAKRVGVESIPVKDFYIKIVESQTKSAIKQVKNHDTQIYKFSENSELDELMDLYTKNIQIKKDDIEIKIVETEGKKNKQISEILKKL